MPGLRTLLISLLLVLLPAATSFGEDQQQKPYVGDKPGEEWVNSIGMVFCWIPPGELTMGSPQLSEPPFHDTEPVKVTLTSGFWMAKYETTVQEYKAIDDLPHELRRRNPGPNRPVTYMNRFAAADFSKKLTERERKAGRLPDGWVYRQPTEAEWEYACRASTTTRYWFGNSPGELHRYANFADAALRSETAGNEKFLYVKTEANDGQGLGPAPVGSYPANPWGLHDMHGNVWEWCRDFYDPQLPGGTDPLVKQKSDGKDRRNVVVRGGAWCSFPEYCCSAFRNAFKRSRNFREKDFHGFRVVLKRTESR